MTQIDVADETWIAAGPERVAAAVADPANWRSWWPDLDLAVDELRGPLGVRWFVRPSAESPASGSMEVWLEQGRGGVVVHYFLRLDHAGAGRTRQAERISIKHRLRAKRIFWTLKDELEDR